MVVVLGTRPALLPWFSTATSEGVHCTIHNLNSEEFSGRAQAHPKMYLGWTFLSGYVQTYYIYKIHSNYFKWHTQNISYV